MKFQVLFVAAAIVAAAEAARAGFSITAVPSAEPAPSGRSAVDLFGLNDSNLADGVNFQAVRLAFTGFNGTKVYFSHTIESDQAVSIDTFNYALGTNGAIRDIGSSNLRIGTRLSSQHSSPDYPSDHNSPVTINQAVNGLTTFNATYGLSGASASAPSTGPLGVRFARLVFNTTTPDFAIVGKVGGEVGPGSDYAMQYAAAVLQTISAQTIVNAPPQTVQLGTLPGSVATFRAEVGAIDVNASANMALAVGAIAGVRDVVVTTKSRGDGMITWDVQGVVDSSIQSSTLSLPLSVTGGTSNAAAVLSLSIVPEPAILSSVAIAGLMLRRQRANVVS